VDGGAIFVVTDEMAYRCIPLAFLQYILQENLHICDAYNISLSIGYFFYKHDSSFYYLYHWFQFSFIGSQLVVWKISHPYSSRFVRRR
jgi:hypothetical protein